MKWTALPDRTSSLFLLTRPEGGSRAQHDAKKPQCGGDDARHVCLMRVMTIRSANQTATPGLGTHADSCRCRTVSARLARSFAGPYAGAPAVMFAEASPCCGSILPECVQA